LKKKVTPVSFSAKASSAILFIDLRVSSGDWNYSQGRMKGVKNGYIHGNKGRNLTKLFSVCCRRGERTRSSSSSSIERRPCPKMISRIERSQYSLRKRMDVKGPKPSHELHFLHFSSASFHTGAHPFHFFR